MKLIKFETETCSSCRRLGSYLDSLGTKYDSIDIVENPEAIEKYNIQASPTLIKLDDNNREIARLVGFNSQEAVRDFLAEE